MTDHRLELSPIGVIRNDFTGKFGIPRQSGLSELLSRVVLEKEYSVPEAFRSLEVYSHLWLIWGFSLCNREQWRPTVRPPGLGGNKRVGVFATRSPYRPNPLGLSSVKLESFGFDAEGRAFLEVRGADLADGTPIYDIKPYLAYTDSHPDARSGWAGNCPNLAVDFPPALLALLPEEKRESCVGVLSQDPRPAYQKDPRREYRMSFGGYEIGFRVEDQTLTVLSVEKGT